MNEFKRLAIPALLLLAACSQQGGNAAAPAGEPPLAGAAIGGPFTLTDQDGKTVKDTDFAGKYRIVYFGYTFCPDVCPVDVQRLMQGYRAFEKDDAAAAAKVQPLFISIDPARDDAAALKAFVGNFHPKLIGLSGTPEQTAAVAKEYAVYYRKAEGGDAENYMMDHSNAAYLMGPDGKPIALLPQDGKPEEIAQTLATWVR